MIHLKFASANFLDQSCFKGRNFWKIHDVPEWILKFHKQDKVSSFDQYLSRKLVSLRNFLQVLRIFPAIARISTRGVSWSRVARFSIFDFSISFPNFFKFSQKILYLGHNYPINYPFCNHEVSPTPTPNKRNFNGFSVSEIFF